MIRNATITRIDTPAGLAGGAMTWTPGPATAIRCCVSAPTRRQRIQFGSFISDATMVVRVLARDLGAGSIAAGARLVVRIDGAAASRTILILHASEAVKPPLSNLVAFGKEV